MKTAETFIGYVRVSTARQGKSGLGLQAQQDAISHYVQGKGSLLKTFREVESGKVNQRPQLEEALMLCQTEKATLVIAKLDRLSRNAAFLLTLQESQARFVCCDMPQADPFTIGILALVAQHERKMISQRIKAALTVTKARGTKLGNPNGWGHAHQLGVPASIKARQTKAIAVQDAALAHLTQVGLVSAPQKRQLESLHAAGILTARGNPWTQPALSKALKAAKSRSITAAQKQLALLGAPQQNAQKTDPSPADESVDHRKLAAAGI